MKRRNQYQKKWYLIKEFHIYGTKLAVNRNLNYIFKTPPMARRSQLSIKITVCADAQCMQFYYRLNAREMQKQVSIIFKMYIFFSAGKCKSFYFCQPKITMIIQKWYCKRNFKVNPSVSSKKKAEYNFFKEHKASSGVLILLRRHF